jgi:hypothetical protein
MQSFNSAKLFLGTTIVAASVGLNRPAIAAPSADFFDGKTSVVLSRDFTNALTTLQIRPGTIGKPTEAGRGDFSNYEWRSRFGSPQNRN